MNNILEFYSPEEKRIRETVARVTGIAWQEYLRLGRGAIHFSVESGNVKYFEAGNAAFADEIEDVEDLCKFNEMVSHYDPETQFVLLGIFSDGFEACIATPVEPYRLSPPKAYEWLQQERFGFLDEHSDSTNKVTQ